SGDPERYGDFVQRFRAATTPQDEPRYLYALTAFPHPELIAQTLGRTINGEIRTQDAPFVVRSLLMTVQVREQAWEFVKKQWDTMDRLYPKHVMRRMAEGVTGLITPELEADVHRFFQERRVEFGGKVLEQYLEQLRVAVALREREGAALAAYVGAGAGAGAGRWPLRSGGVRRGERPAPRARARRRRARRRRHQPDHRRPRGR